MKISLNYIFIDHDRHGNRRVYVRRYRNGAKVRIKAQPGTQAFMIEYQTALDHLEAPGEHVRIAGRKIALGSLGALAVKYFASREFRRLNTKSQSTRRGIIEDCLREKIADGKTIADGPAKLFNASHVRWLMECKEAEELFGAAVNRHKYISAMLGWAIEQSPQLVTRNAARDVRVTRKKSNGFYTWTDKDVKTYEACYPIGTKERLALGLLMFTGVRRQDVVALGPSNEGKSADGNAVFSMTPKKLKDERPEPVEKPLLPQLAAIIKATPTIGLKSYLVTSKGEPFTDNGFGNWFRGVCDKAGLPQCTAHGLRKAAACRCADDGVELYDMMSLFDWTSPAVALRYIKMAKKKKGTARAIQSLVRSGSDGEQNR